MAYSDYDNSNQEWNLTLKCTLRDVQTLSLSLRMDVEQRVIIKFLRFKRMKLVDIHHQLHEVFGEETYAFPRAKYWTHQLETGRTIMTNDV
jgi:hypothetical protein